MRRFGARETVADPRQPPPRATPNNSMRRYIVDFPGPEQLRSSDDRTVALFDRAQNRGPLIRLERHRLVRASNRILSGDRVLAAIDRLPTPCPRHPSVHRALRLVGSGPSAERPGESTGRA